MALDRIRILNAEIVNDPLSRTYSGMTDQAAADDLNTPYRTIVVTATKSAVVLEATLNTEYNALTASQQRLYHSLLAMGEINLNGANTQDIFKGLFTAGTTTRTNLIALSTRPVSRAEELVGNDVTITATVVAAARRFVE